MAPIKNNYIEDIKFAIQVNGKTRDIITVKKMLIRILLKK